MTPRTTGTAGVGRHIVKDLTIVRVEGVNHLAGTSGNGEAGLQQDYEYKGIELWIKVKPETVVPNSKWTQLKV